MLLNACFQFRFRPLFFWDDTKSKEKKDDAYIKFYFISTLKMLTMLLDDAKWWKQLVKMRMWNVRMSSCNDDETTTRAFIFIFSFFISFSLLLILLPRPSSKHLHKKKVNSKKFALTESKNQHKNEFVKKKQSYNQFETTTK